jgi:AcrR family transcriptional regulator
METRERLVRSAQALLWERGYVGTSPAAIQKRAGVGQGSMYHHFASKSDLALAAIQRCSLQIRSLVEKQFGGDGSAYERIEAYLLSERKVLRGCQIGRLTQDPEILSNPLLRQPVEETFAWVRSRMVEILKEGQDNGEFSRQLDMEDVAEMVMSVLQGGIVLALAAGDERPYYRASKGVLSMLALSDNR